MKEKKIWNKKSNYLVKSRCWICPFPLEINPTEPRFENTEKICYSNFFIFKEDKFLRNIYSKEELNGTQNLKNIELFHKSFVKFLKIIVVLQSALDCYDKTDDSLDNTLLEFRKNECLDCSNFDDIKNKIKDV